MIGLAIIAAALACCAVRIEVKHRRRQRKLATVVYPPRWFPDGDPMQVAS